MDDNLTRSCNTFLKRVLLLLILLTLLVLYISNVTETDVICPADVSPVVLWSNALSFRVPDGMLRTLHIP